MINNQDKINLIIDKLNNIEGDMISYIEHANTFQNKYSLEEVLTECNAAKSALLAELNSLGGIWPVPLD